MIHKREYNTYKEYLMHQASKTDRDELKREVLYADRTERFRAKFLVVFSRFKQNCKVLCIAARMGEEVDALRILGFDAEGIDINPRKDVKKMDMHDLKYEDGTFELVYTNSLDHAYDLEKVASEIHRVLVDGGYFIAEQKLLPEDCVKDRNKYESLTWDSITELKNAMKPLAFEYSIRLNTNKPFHVWVKNTTTTIS